MFRFDFESEWEMLRTLDELRLLMGLPSRGHVVELAIRRLSAGVESNRSSDAKEAGGKSGISDETLVAPCSKPRNRTNR